MTRNLIDYFSLNLNYLPPAEEALASNPKNRKSLGMLLCQQNLLCLKDS